MKRIATVIALNVFVLSNYACDYYPDQKTCHAATSTYIGHDCGQDLYDSTTAGQQGISCGYDVNASNNPYLSCTDQPIPDRCTWTRTVDYCDSEGDVQTTSTPKTGDLPSVVTTPCNG
jgi:hypothetical protein